MLLPAPTIARLAPTKTLPSLPTTMAALPAPMAAPKPWQYC